MVYLFEGLDIGVGIDVDGYSMLIRKRFVSFNFEVNIVNSSLNLNESVDALMVSFDVLAIIIVISLKSLFVDFTFLAGQ